jgi:hypothetical protein
MRDGFLSRSLPLTSSLDFHMVQYADNALLILLADEGQLLFLKILLTNFGSAIRLKVNYDKSNMIPINISDGRLHVVLQTLQCQKGIFPFTYLGLPDLEKSFSCHFFRVLKEGFLFTPCTSVMVISSCW